MLPAITCQSGATNVTIGQRHLHTQWKMVREQQQQPKKKKKEKKEKEEIPQMGRRVSSIINPDCYYIQT